MNAHNLILETIAVSVEAGLPAKRPAQATEIPMADHLADLAVEALIDEADLSPKPGLVDRRSNGTHPDMSLALMHASALSLWPCLRQMVEAAQTFGEISQPLRASLGQLGREGEAAMLATTGGVNTHRGAIWALGLLVAATALDTQADASTLAARAGRLALLDDPVLVPQDSHGQQVRRRYGAGGAREQAQQGFPPSSATACHNCNAAAPPVPASNMPGLTRCWRSWPCLATPACSGAAAQPAWPPCSRARWPYWPKAAALPWPGAGNCASWTSTCCT